MHSDHYFRGILSQKTPSTCLVRSEWFPKTLPKKSSQTEVVSNVSMLTLLSTGSLKGFPCKIPPVSENKWACMPWNQGSFRSILRVYPVEIHWLLNPHLVEKIYTFTPLKHISIFNVWLPFFDSKTRCWSEVRFHHCHRHLALEAPRSFFNGDGADGEGEIPQSW